MEIKTLKVTISIRQKPIGEKRKINNNDILSMSVEQLEELKEKYLKLAEVFNKED